MKLSFTAHNAMHSAALLLSESLELPELGSLEGLGEEVCAPPADESSPEYSTSGDGAILVTGMPQGASSSHLSTTSSQQLAKQLGSTSEPQVPKAEYDRLMDNFATLKASYDAALGTEGVGSDRLQRILAASASASGPELPTRQDMPRTSGQHRAPRRSLLIDTADAEAIAAHALALQASHEVLQQQYQKVGETWIED